MYHPMWHLNSALHETLAPHSLQFRVLAHCPPKDIGPRGTSDGRSYGGDIFPRHAIHIVLGCSSPQCLDEEKGTFQFLAGVFDILFLLLLFYILVLLVSLWVRELGKQTKKIPLMIGTQPHSTGCVQHVEQRPKYDQRNENVKPTALNLSPGESVPCTSMLHITIDNLCIAIT